MYHIVLYIKIRRCIFFTQALNQNTVYSAIYPINRNIQCPLNLSYRKDTIKDGRSKAAVDLTLQTLQSIYQNIWLVHLTLQNAHNNSDYVINALSFSLPLRSNCLTSGGGSAGAFHVFGGKFHHKFHSRCHNIIKL